MTRSISGHIILLKGPLHWKASRQTITARSSAESEIYATDNCVKEILRLSHIIEDLNLHKHLMSTTTPIFNNNMACAQWSNKKTNRNIRHIQIREMPHARQFTRKKLKYIMSEGKTIPPTYSQKNKRTLHIFSNFVTLFFLNRSSLTLHHKISLQCLSPKGGYCSHILI